MPRSASRVVANEREVRRAAADDTRIEYRVRGTPNLVLRVSPGGGKVWVFHYRRAKDTKWRSRSLGKWPTVDLARARDDALKLTLAVREGEDPRTVFQRLSKGVMSFRAMATAYLAEHAVKHARQGQKSAWTRECERILRRNVVPEIGDYPADAVTRSDVAAAVDKVARRGSYRLADLTLGTIRAVYNWGVDTGNMREGVDPTRGLRKRHVGAARDRTLSDDELRRLWQRLGTPGKLSPGIRDALRLELLLGVRIGEAVGAAKSEFDCDKKVWTIPGARTKNGREHRLPLPDFALALIVGAMERAVDNHWVFPSPRADGPIRPKSASRAVLRIQLQWAKDERHRYRSHDLRRSLATRLGDAGFGDDVIGRVLNHRPQTVTGRHYNHAVRFEAIREALAWWAGELQRILGVTASSVQVAGADHQPPPCPEPTSSPLAPFMSAA
jgi:integrase